MNLLLEADKPKVTQSIVVYGGRFQPFHKGHYAAYQNLVSEFGKANVYIGTSNDTSSDKSPFTFKEKKEIATKMFGIPASKFVKVNNPYRPVEILSKYDGKITQYIAAVGEKDASRLKSGYFKPYKGKAGYGYNEVGYYYTVPAEANPISGTDVRKKLGSSNKEVAKKFFLKAYPSFDKDIFKMISSKLNEDGMPGGIGVGLVLPGGYINGAPTGSKNEIIGEIENEVNEFITQYFNEGISESKENSINHFVEYATKKLKLKETPKITLLTGREYSEAKTSLGGYNPMSKEIYVAIEGRLTADILRTLAHEMVHRKQDELGLVKDEVKDGATGSPIENQAHAVAGILMRNYGKINKQIYNESINIDVDKGDTVLMGKFKNKKVVVKDIGKDDYGMPTINGKKATTFRLGDKGQNIFKKDETTQIEKESNLKPSFDEQIDELYKDVENFIDDYLGEVSNIQISNTADVPDGSFIPKGKKRKLNTTKSEDWYTNGGYTQTDFPKADAIFGDDDAEERTITYSIKNLPEVDYVETEFIKEGLLMEGGAYGHMSHPFDDMDLTFGDLKDIISKALNGDLGVVREKTDGQALAISWKNGRLIAARNKGNLANAGANAMGIEDVASKFGGRGGLTDAYNFAMRDLSAAISGLSDSQRKKIFNEGKCFMNLEVIWPTSVNVIPYGQALLVFHNTTCYDEKGTAIGADGGAAGTLAGMIKQINADVQSKYTIQGPPITSIPKSENLSSKQGKYISKLAKLQKQFGLSDSDNVANYHQSWWENFIDKNSPIKVDKLTKEALVRRWAFGDKGFRLTTISKPELQEWAIDHDKVNVAKQQKDNIKPFEEIFLGVGADILEFVGSVLTVHPEKAIRSMKQKFKQVATQVRNGGSPAQIQKLKSELERLNQLGGIDKIVANEGLVFFYNGKTYKLTGTFAPLNQILGIFYS
jgi:hypothetical protein